MTAVLPVVPDATTRALSVLTALDVLGDSATAVADCLSLLGIDGYLRSTIDCPIARYLRQQFPHADWEVTADRVCDRAGRVEITPPPAIRRFIDGFDDGLYLGLVRVPAESV